MTIYYKKLFKSGNLKGFIVSCLVSFPDSSLERYAKTFRIGHKGSDCITKSRYEIVDASFQDFNR
jgi:hypothetical protein